MCRPGLEARHGWHVPRDLSPPQPAEPAPGRAARQSVRRRKPPGLPAPPPSREPFTRPFLLTRTCKVQDGGDETLAALRLLDAGLELPHVLAARNSPHMNLVRSR